MKHPEQPGAKDLEALPDLLTEPDLERFIEYREISKEDLRIIEELAEYQAHVFHVLHNYFAGQIKFDAGQAREMVFLDQRRAEENAAAGKEPEIPSRIFELLGEIIEKYDAVVAYALIREMEEVLPKRERYRKTNGN